MDRRSRRGGGWPRIGSLGRYQWTDRSEAASRLLLCLPLECCWRGALWHCGRRLAVFRRGRRRQGRNGNSRLHVDEGVLAKRAWEDDMKVSSSDESR